MTGQARMVKLAELWKRKSAKGTVYFSGYMGDCQILLFKEGRKPHPTKPDEEVIVWNLLVQERDPNRRPQQKREQQYPRERSDPRQEAVDGWAARFDERRPDAEPGF
jgi:hypothetical protein